MTIPLTLRRELTASRTLAIELSRDLRDGRPVWIGRVIDGGSLLKATPAYPSAQEALTSAEFEYHAVVEARVHAVERAEDEGHECWRCGSNEPGCVSCGGRIAREVACE